MSTSLNSLYIWSWMGVSQPATPSLLVSRLLALPWEVQDLDGWDVPLSLDWGDDLNEMQREVCSSPGTAHKPKTWTPAGFRLLCRSVPYK